MTYMYCQNINYLKWKSTYKLTITLNNMYSLKIDSIREYADSSILRGSFQMTILVLVMNKHKLLHIVCKRAK